MASIRKRGSVYQARVSRKGFPQEVKTFESKAEAERWGRSVEAAMDDHSYRRSRPAEDMLLSALIRRYREAVTPSKRGARDEAIRLRKLERDRLASYTVANVTPSVVAEYRDRRLQTCCAATVVRDLAVLSSIFTHARREWQIGSSNPVSDVRKPSPGLGRDRLLQPQEEIRMFFHAQPQGRRNPLLEPLLRVALETAMRKGELLRIEWADVDLERAVVKLRMTKNGSVRWVPLSTKAVDVLSRMKRNDSPRVFPVQAAALDRIFRRLCERADLLDLRFHDLRHTATTRLAAKLPNVIELAAVTGHQSLQMLKRYYHPRAEDLALKLG
ncbi:integrase [Roseateles noduli]|nr:integrase [Roseateles noduli]